LGKNSLVAKTQSGNQEGLEAYFREGYPSNVLEVVEQFHAELPTDQRTAFAKFVNDSMMAFKCPWLLLDGAFFRIDDHFLKSLSKIRNPRWVREGSVVRSMNYVRPVKA
jgi:hypothetical protein